ncbi:MAG: TIGR04211 family SH3 domain-containing protein [Desulfuromonas sp.]|nr:MAG: TIGR04211 family SH3 domain-containing protein [Desulfuromonas sp.]
MRHPFHTLTAFFLLLLLSSTAGAETRYITEKLVVTVRDQKGKSYKTLESIPSATAIEVLEEDKTYLKVRTPKGTEGYVLKQYVTKQLPKAKQIEQLQTEVDSLKTQLQQLEQATQSNEGTEKQNQARITELTAQLEEARTNASDATEKYEQLVQASGNIVNLSTENEQLIEENNQLTSELTVLREENSNFHRSNMIQWFLAGAGVFFGGWIIGKISRKRQRGFSRF